MTEHHYSKVFHMELGTINDSNILDEYNFPIEKWLAGEEITEEDRFTFLEESAIAYECGARIVLYMFEGEADDLDFAEKSEQTYRRILFYILSKSGHVTHPDDKNHQYILECLAQGDPVTYAGICQLGRYVIVWAGVDG